MNTLARSIAGMALSAGAVYLLDPVSGHRRRLLMSDQCARAARRAELGTRDARHDVSERAHAVAARTKSALTRDQASDKAVFKHAREVLRHATHPASIELAVRDGHVLVRGSILAQEHQRLLDELRAVRGVRMVTDHLTAHGVMDSPHALEAGHEFRSAAAPSGWKIAGRVLGVCASGALLVWGVRERKAVGAFGASVGHTLWRISKQELDRGIDATDQSIRESEETLAEAADSAHDKVEEGVQWAEAARDATLDKYAQARRRSAEIVDDGAHVGAAR